MLGIQDGAALGRWALGKFTTTLDIAATYAGSGNLFVLSGAALMRPDADTSTGSWTNEVDAAVLFPSIDEAIIDDADYIKSSATPANDVCKIRLSDPLFSPAQPFSVNYRYRKSGSLQIDLTVRLLEGVTQIATFTHTNIADTFVTAEQILTTPQFTSITDFTNLFIEFTANKP
jgi:hypothetical protein